MFLASTPLWAEVDISSFDPFCAETEIDNIRIYIHYLLCVLPVEDVLVLVDGQQFVICHSHQSNVTGIENLAVDGLGFLVPPLLLPHVPHEPQ